MNICLSIIESIYICYMFIFFKTNYSIHHPFEKNMTYFHKFIKHPIHTGIYENKICMLGKVVSILLSLWFIIRNYIIHKCKRILNRIIILSVAVGCLLMNLNAFIYFLPILFIELCDI
jgi:hypothetical protein